MEKLKRLQEGGDVEDLLAELDEELPSDDEEEEEDEEDAYLTEVQKKVSAFFSTLPLKNWHF